MKTMAFNKHTISSIFNKLVRLSFKLMILAVIVFASQLGQYMISIDDARMHAIAEWNDKNPDRIDDSVTFINDCLNSRPKEINENLETEFKKAILVEEKPISIYDCGEKLGVGSLMLDLKKMDNSMISLAWPLSIFTDNL